MSLAYRILYAIGFTPWEQMADPATNCGFRRET
jgi:hypothetical protein